MLQWRVAVAVVVVVQVGVVDQAVEADELHQVPVEEEWDEEAGEWDAPIISPPCNPWSRAPWTNKMGPRPIRSFVHPWVFPWLKCAAKLKCVVSNLLVAFAPTTCWMKGADRTGWFIMLL